jgi:hypothetical protein
MPTYDTNVFSTGFENPGMGAVEVDSRVKYSNSIVHVGGQSMHIDNSLADAFYPVKRFSAGLGNATYTSFAFYYSLKGNNKGIRLNLCQVGNANLLPGQYVSQNPSGYCGSAWWINPAGYMGGRATVGESSGGRTNGGQGDLINWEPQTGEYNRTLWTLAHAPQSKWHWLSIYTETKAVPYLTGSGSIRLVYDAKTSAKLNGEPLGTIQCQYHNPYWSEPARNQNIGADLEYIRFTGHTFYDLYIDNYVSSITELPEGESLA